MSSDSIVTSRRRVEIQSTSEMTPYFKMTKCNKLFTVEPLKEDPPRKGHCIKYLSTKDKTKSPNLSLPINIM